jgi:hypothetical protein
LLEPETFISNLIKDELRSIALNLSDKQTR